MHISNKDLLIGGIVGGVILNDAANQRSKAQVDAIATGNRNLLQEQRLTNKLLLMTAEERTAYAAMVKRAELREAREEEERNQREYTTIVTNAMMVIDKVGMRDSNWQTIKDYIVFILLAVTFVIGLCSWFFGPIAAIIVGCIWCCMANVLFVKPRTERENQRNIIKDHQRREANREEAARRRKSRINPTK